MAKKFYELNPKERLDQLALPTELTNRFLAQQDTKRQNLIENYLTDFALPEGIIKNLVLDEQLYQVPLVVEEPSVVAAANNGARMFALGGGFHSVGSSRALLTGQILFDQVDVADVQAFVDDHRQEIEAAAQAAKPSLYQRGGGLQDLVLRELPGRRASLDLVVDTNQAMGANAVNTILEAVKALFMPYQEQILGAILSNAGDHSLVSVSGRVPVMAVGGLTMAKRIVALSEFAKVDPKRAVTENKGVFNGLSAAVLALGNDWRAVEAAGHAYASQGGQYRSLTQWRLEDDQEFLVGELTLPLNIGTVGGALASLQTAQDNFAILGQPDADRTKKILLAVGLSSNLAALKAVAGAGIQAGHMKMQARTLAVQVGAKAEEVAALAAALAQTTINETTAKRLLGEMRQNGSKN